MSDPYRQHTPARPSRVLIVEDHDAAAAALASVLRSAGYAATCVATVAAARAALEDARVAGDRFVAVVADLMLPDGLGWDAFASTAAAGAAVVLAMTAGDPELLAEAVRRGATAVIRKPFDADGLLALLPRP